MNSQTKTTDMFVETFYRIIMTLDTSCTVLKVRTVEFFSQYYLQIFSPTWWSCNPRVPSADGCMSYWFISNHTLLSWWYIFSCLWRFIFLESIQLKKQPCFKIYIYKRMVLVLNTYFVINSWIDFSLRSNRNFSGCCMTEVTWTGERSKSCQMSRHCPSSNYVFHVF